MRNQISFSSKSAMSDASLSCPTPDQLLFNVNLIRFNSIAVSPKVCCDHRSSSLPDLAKNPKFLELYFDMGESIVF
jgi:hypothetical protein